MQKTRAPDISDLWIQHQRKHGKTVLSYACVLCPDRQTFADEFELWVHALAKHVDQLPSDEEKLKVFREQFKAKSAMKKPTSPQQRPAKRPNDPPPGRPPTQTHSKWLHLSPKLLPSTRSLLSLGVLALNISGEQAMAEPIDETYDLILQPEIRPISKKQLVAEVKGIYAGLVMVEAKCIEVDNKQAKLAQAGPSAQPKLKNEQWQALLALHRTLLHEHHDFFLASQHPSASPALRRLASKYAIPARMWRHRIHSLLELLRHRLPASLDHILAFIYLSYSMMALLYETVPAFEDIWIECLAELGRYRMAIEDDDIRDIEVWSGVARNSYSKASDKAPITGRLYHHLSILTRPNSLQQLFYYSNSLCVTIPFTSAKEPVLTLFDTRVRGSQYKLSPLDTAFVRAHVLIFTKRNEFEHLHVPEEFLDVFDNQIGKVARQFVYSTLKIVSRIIGDQNGLLLMDVAPGFPLESLVLMLDTLPKEDESGPLHGFIHDKQYAQKESSTRIKLVSVVNDTTSKSAHVDQPSVGVPLKNGKDLSADIEPPDTLTPITTHDQDVKDEIQDDDDDAAATPRSQTPKSIVSVVDVHSMYRTASTLGSELRRLISIIMKVMMMSHFSLVQAAPTEVRPSKTEIFVTKWDDMWTNLVENYAIEAISVVFECVALYFAFRTIVWLDRYLLEVTEIIPAQQTRAAAPDPAPSRPQDSLERDLEENREISTMLQQKHSHTLLWWNNIMAWCVFFLGRNDKFVTYALVPLWLFSFSLNAEYLKQRLLPFSKSAGETFFQIIALAGGTAGGFAYASAPLNGRCSDWVTYGTLAFLPSLAFYSAKWAATIRNSGRAKHIEEAYGIDDVLAEEMRKLAIDISLQASEHPSSEQAIDVQSAILQVEGTSTKKNNKRRRRRQNYAKGAH